MGKTVFGRDRTYTGSIALNQSHVREDSKDIRDFMSVQSKS